MKALVIGASGLVGGALMRVLAEQDAEALGTYHNRPSSRLLPLDISDPQAVSERIGTLKPKVVYLAGALGSVDYCEENPEEAFRINADGVRHVAESAAGVGAELVFYSTDAIFDGEHGPYSENATPNPICVYGHTKVGAEQAIRETIANHLIIRTTAVFGWDRASKNFAMGLWERLTGGEPMLVPNDQWCNPTLASYLAEASMKLVEKGQVGTFNVAGKDLITRSELAYRLARILNLDSSLLTSVPFHQLGRKTRLPLRGGFELDKFKAALETEPLPLDQALERFELHRQTDNLDVK